MSTSKTKIVADGDQRYRDAMDYDAVYRRVFAEVSRRFESEKANAPLWGRCWLEVKILREVRDIMKREFPGGSLHISSLERRS